MTKFGKKYLAPILDFRVGAIFPTLCNGLPTDKLSPNLPGWLTVWLDILSICPGILLSTPSQLSVDCRSVHCQMERGGSKTPISALLRAPTLGWRWRSHKYNPKQSLLNYGSRRSCQWCRIKKVAIATRCWRPLEMPKSVTGRGGNAAGEDEGCTHIFLKNPFKNVQSLLPFVNCSRHGFRMEFNGVITKTTQNKSEIG